VSHLSKISVLNYLWMKLLLRLTLGIMSVLLLTIALTVIAGVGLRGSGQIAFISQRNGRGQIYTLDIDRGVLVNLSRNHLENLGLVWSPDGGRIAFQTYVLPQGIHDVYLMNADGSHPHPLRSNNSDIRQGLSWSPNGKQLAYYAPTRYKGGSDIYVMNVDGSDIHNITDDSLANLNPAWSPDGQQLAFTSFEDNNWEIYVTEIGPQPVTLVVQRSRFHRLTYNNTNDFKPTWSPDGQKLAFVSERDGNMEIYLMDADGSHIRRLTYDAAADSSPNWSSDGSEIVFVSNRHRNGEIFVMTADGSNVRRLTYNSAVDQSPVWWP
jgi:Tol biopolymer transport system component